MSDGVISKIQLPDENTYDIIDSTSGYITGMTILSYGSSTWQDFINAYNSNKVVYCRASSNSNPASGSQTRLAFMAYVNNASTPTNVEFQYYRSVSTHTESQQGDQVFVYKLDKTNGWSVTTREASVKVVAGTGLGGTYSNGTMTLTGPTKVSDLTNDSEFIDTAGTGLSKSGTTLNHTNSITAQTTSAVYPIKIDAQGHISSYGSALNLKNGVGTGSLIGQEASTITNAGTNSLALGYRTSAGGVNSASMGYWSTAGGNCSFAFGEEVIAQRKHNTVIGKFNILDTGGSDATTDGNYAFIVGNGTSSSNRSNAFTVNWQGDIVASGTITDGNGNILGTISSTSTPTASTIAQFDSSAQMNSTDMTSQEVSDFVGNLGYSFNLIDMFYPVGSYYETSDTSFDPNISWGGTWVQETSGQVHVSAGGSYSVSGALNNTSDGGASTVKLTSAQSGVPKHSHTYTRPTVATGGGGHSHTATLKYRNAVPTNGSSAQPWAEGTLSSTGTVTIAANSGTHSHTLTGGGVADNTAADASSAHNNMQPYIVVNRWHRIA